MGKRQGEQKDNYDRVSLSIDLRRCTSDSLTGEAGGAGGQEGRRAGGAGAEAGGQLR